MSARFITSATAALVLVSGIAAQHKPVFKRSNVSPVFAGTYHPALGFQPHQTQRLGPELIWNNNRLLNYYSPGSGTDQEWIDEGVLPDRNSTYLGSVREQINGFNFTYCSTEPDPGTGVVTTTITFYDETIRCAGPPNWPAADCGYVLVGLPGGDPNGAVECWVVSVDLEGGGFECDLTTDASNNKLFGWGGAYDNDQTGPWVAIGGHGADDSWTWFDHTNLNGAFVGCFWFGWPPGKFAMQLYGNPRNAFATYSLSEGAGADDQLVLSTDVEAVPSGQVVLSTTDLSGLPVLTVMWVSQTLVDHNLSASFGIDAHELAQWSTRIAEILPPAANNVVIVPPSAAGAYYLQAMQLNAGAPVALSNALEIWI